VYIYFGFSLSYFLILLQHLSTHAELIAGRQLIFQYFTNQFIFSIALCICAEQTFIEASAQRDKFAELFANALVAYIESSIRKSVAQAIVQLSAANESEQLYQIIINHHLRM